VNVRDGDTLLEVCLTNGSCHIVMALRSGKAIRFHEDAVREMGRSASGVRGITLASEEDEVVGMVCVDKSETDDVDVLVLSERGYGKRTPILDYPATNRGGKGVKTMQVTEKTGKLVGLAAVTKDQDLMIITAAGIAIRIPVKAISQLGRATQGVRVIRLEGEEQIASIARLAPEEETETSPEDENYLNQLAPVSGLEGEEPLETLEDDLDEDDSPDEEDPGDDELDDDDTSFEEEE
jgi:DNA gyrase subunit A